MTALKKIWFALFALAIAVQISAQETDEVEDSTVSLDPEPVEFVFRPKLSLGIGMFTFYGDVSNNHDFYHPTVSRLAYELKLINPLTDYLDLNFYVLFGQVSANERTLTRNLNFQSNITTGGMTFTYNFKNFSDFKGTGVNPFISAGFESVEFLSKSDLKDANGNTYHYWQDGRIMNLAENDPNAASAFEIYRDYTYESDLRELNLDSNGKYPERTFAFPVAIGANFEIGEKMDFKVSTSMHFTRSDLIDNVTGESFGDRAGTKGMDKFLYTSASMTYDLTWGSGKKEIDDPYDDEWYELFKQDTSDYDKDGVADLADLCAKTPLSWQPVDEFGCPLDDDQDGVPNSIDDELDTELKVNVDTNGVTLTDEDYFLSYRIYKDSIGEFAVLTESRNSTESEGPSGPQLVNVPKPTKDKFTVVVGTDSIGVTEEELHQMLGDKEFSTVQVGDETIYTIGDFDDAQDAVNKLEQIRKAGLNGEVVKVTEGDNGDTQFEKVDPDNLPDPDMEAVTSLGNFGSKETIYKVQIGAFSKQLSKNVFSDVSDLDYIKGDDGLWRYYSGTFNSKDEAARHRVNIIEDGYNGSFLVAYRNGKRLTLKEAGYDVNPNYNDTNKESSEETEGVINAELIKFKIQVGAFENKIPLDILDLYLSIGNVVPKRDGSSGLTKYLMGTYDSYEEAEAAKEELKSKGLTDAFIVGDFNGKLIPASDALKLIK